MGSRLCAPILRDALFLSHFQPHEVYKHPDSSQIIQSCLCCLLDTTSTRSAFTSTSAAPGCSKPRRRGRSSVTLFMSTKRTEDFHSQVNCTWNSASFLCHTRNSTSFLSVVQGLALGTVTGCHTGSHSNSFLSCLWRKSPAQLSLSLLPGATIYCV